MNPTMIYSADPKIDPSPARLAAADTPPPWRQYAAKRPGPRIQRMARPMDAGQQKRGRAYRGKPHEATVVNAALFLRRPLLVTGDAGVGKSTLAYSVAWQLGLGNVLRWGVTSRSTLKEALYQYDAVGRLNEAARRRHAAEQGDAQAGADDIGRFITLGPLGTALLPTHADGYFPRVLLVDEIDKSDADLPSDLLHVLEEGSFLVPEIARLPVPKSGERQPARVSTADPAAPDAEVSADGWVCCDDFPLIIMTSNGERDFPPAFLRRCLRLDLKRNRADLDAIVNAHMADAVEDGAVRALIDEFGGAIEARRELATDQLLNAIFLQRNGFDLGESEQQLKRAAIFRSLNESPTGEAP